MYELSYTLITIGITSNQFTNLVRFFAELEIIRQEQIVKHNKLYGVILMEIIM